MAYSVLIPNKIAAMNIDAFNRSIVCASDLENGNVVVLASKSATAGESEVWTATIPATATLNDGLWMVYSPEVVVTNAQYKGLDPDPRNFLCTSGEIWDAFRLQVGDIVTLTDDSLNGTKSTNEFVVATDGRADLTWAGSAISGLSLKLLGTTYISLATGAIGTQRVTAYQFEVVALA